MESALRDGQRVVVCLPQDATHGRYTPPVVVGATIRGHWRPGDGPVCVVLHGHELPSWVESRWITREVK